MDFLDAGCVIAGDDDFVVAGATGFAAVFTREQDGGDAEVMSGSKSREDIGAVAAGGEADEDIGRFSEGLDRSGKDLVVAVVVANAGNGSGVRV